MDISNSQIPSFIGERLSNYQAIDMLVLPTEALALPQLTPKRLRPEAVQLCARNIERYGQIKPILLDDNNVIIEGFEFFEAAKLLGLTYLHVVRVLDLTPGEKKALMLALAKLPELSDWDDKSVHILIEEIEIEDPELIDLTGFETAEIDVIHEYDDDHDEDSEDEQQPHLPDEKVTVSKPGDVFQMGGHRVICGNALEPSTYEVLMAGATAQTVATDPPFNIKIEGHVSGLGKKKHSDFAMAAGEMSFTQFEIFLGAFMALVLLFICAGGLLYVFMDRRNLEQLLLAGRKLNLKIQDLCIWDKMSGGMGGLYRSQHEPCVVFKYGDAPHKDNVKLGKFGRYRTNVWKHRGLSSFGKDRSEALNMHPTVKPLAIMAEIIKDCTRSGDIVLDPFLGSGTTLMAAEKTDRICYGIELDPKYVDVIIRRWQAQTGKDAILEGTGQSFNNLNSLREAAISGSSNDLHSCEAEINHEEQ
jgi:DNA modification methylase